MCFPLRCLHLRWYEYAAQCRPPALRLASSARRLCRCCLAAAALVRGRGARLLVRRAREVLELFVALAPTRVSSPVPHLSLLLHNDCRYLAHACLTLPLPYHARLDAAAAADATLVSLVEPLRALAAATLRAALHAQSAALLSTLRRAEGFVSVGEDEAAGAAAQRATHQLVRELALLRPQWCETLPRGVALSSVSRLAEAVLRPLYESLVALRHISERDSRALHKVLSFLLPACEQLLSAAARSPLDGRCEHLVPSLRRCRQLGRLLDARLAEVVAWWGEGELDAISARDLLVLLRAIWNEEALLANAREMHRALVTEAAL
mmetsp:Transcript_242/g.748  ORF Transcript_242/g.748 Transcript_242/m.748 type:complete len:322 (-) Transcript_242:200-1165(-)